MADDSYMGQILGWLKGIPATTVNLAPPMANYPTDADADYARNYGFGNGNINEDYLNNNKARVLGGTTPNKTFIPFSGAGHTLSALTSATNDPKASTVVDLNDPKNSNLQGDLRNLFTKAALAANRNPIAAIGFDPERVTLDSLLSGKATYGGAYDPKSEVDGIYSTIDPTDSVLHESIHRGLKKLRDQYPNETQKAFQSLPSEESVVRWLMYKNGGNPEGGSDAPVAEEQKQKAIGQFTGAAGPSNEAVNQLQELAIQSMKNRGKRVGPQ